ncbi:RadC family protein, partial [uncultured Duncaniella sp.]|uniref:JAB domain-containing protein n=1 Tax=uncultured Duncaniella sp. TaxID=2768039 RepID=UPI00265B4A37
LGHEEFWVLYLSKSNEVISERMVGKGGLDATVVDVRVIMRDALLLSASAVAFVHNHPSGNMKPSIQDKALTEKLAEAARMLDIRVLDHIIVGGTKGYFSFCDEGLL